MKWVYDGPFSQQHHCNSILSRKSAGISLIAIFLSFSKSETGLTKMTTIACFLCSLEAALSTFTNVRALKKHTLNSTWRTSFFHCNCCHARNAFIGIPDQFKTFKLKKVLQIKVK